MAEKATYTCNLPGNPKRNSMTLKVSLAPNTATNEEKVKSKISIQFEGGIYQTENQDTIDAMERCGLYGSEFDRVENVQTEEGTFIKQVKTDYGPSTDYLIRQEQDKREYRRMGKAPDPNALDKPVEEPTQTSDIEQVVAERPPVLPKYKLQKMNIAKLQAHSKLMGVAFKFGCKKADLIAGIVEAQK